MTPDDVTEEDAPDDVAPDVPAPDVVVPDVVEDVTPDVPASDVAPDVPAPDVAVDVAPDVPAPDVAVDVAPDVPAPDVVVDVAPDVPAPDVVVDVTPDVPEPVQVVDGEACTADSDCLGGFCIPSPDWPGGYCTTVGCSTFADCASNGEDNRCLTGSGTENFCVRICDSVFDCRLGYTCQPVGGGLGYCAPDGSTPLEIDPDDYPYELECGIVPSGGVATYDFTIASSTTAYMVTPFARDGGDVRPLRIERPRGGSITFADNDFRLTPSFLFGFINPLIIPMTPALDGEVTPGDHRLVVETNSRELCAYVLQESGPNTTIDLNVYLVGVPGVVAATAPGSRALRTVFETFDEIYGARGVTIGTLRYFDVAPEVEEAYAIVRSQGDLEALVATTSIPGPALQDVLSMNVFFTEAFSFSDGSGAIGISAGLPGAAGLHGTRSSGVAFTSEFLGQTFADGTDGSEYTAIVLAHEIGHYLGLFHTSEQNLRSFDPLADTPQCSAAEFPDDCPDLTNLMFPFAGITHRVVTADQGFTIRANPLTR